MKGLQKYWIADGSKLAVGLSRFLSHVLLFFIAIYRTIGTNHFGGCCRFEPSCSEYAASAVQTHRPFFAIKIITLRLLKCRPGGPWGEDPLPSARTSV